MNEILLNILLSISSLLGVNDTPKDSNWHVVSGWQYTGGSSNFTAEANIQDICNKGSTLSLPMIIHGAHQLSVDGKMIATFGDPSFKKATPFYLKPSIECSRLTGEKLTWTAYSYAQYFARFSSFPKANKITSAEITLFHEILNIISGTGLLLLSFITSIIFFRKIRNKVFVSNIIANLGFALYFIFSCSNYFLFDISMLTAHKIADVGVWAGIMSFSIILRDLELFSKLTLRVVLAFSGAATLIILFADNGDSIQFGTSLPFPCLIAVLIGATYNSVKKLRKNFRANITQTVSVLFFFFSGVYEIGIVVGLADASPLLSVGILGALIAITLIVQAGITNTYKQRDELLNELENKVEARTHELKDALKEKELAQAELIQSAKLASLGTLSAGIAHEINNNINYVNACVVGLERELNKISNFDKTKLDKLIYTIKHGTGMTIEIVNSLRNYTGLNQAKMKDIEFQEIVASVKSIIRRKTEHIKFVENYGPGTTLHCNVVGMNQVMMNLITNSADAMDKPDATISISARAIEDDIEIQFSDNGSGIPAKIRDKIFDPFFTTKDVGSGTGLGLHIVRKEIENHGGTIKVISSEGQGTTFIMRLPAKSRIKAAA